MEPINPFWFKLEPAHIEQNLQQAVLYLARAYRDGMTRDDKLRETTDLLYRLADETAPDTGAKTIKIFGSAVLASMQDGIQEGALRFLLKLYECLCLLVPRAVPVLAEAAVRALTGKRIVSPGFSWSDILSGDYGELFATKAAQNLVTDGPTRDVWYEGKGCVHTDKGTLAVFSGNCDEARSLQAKAFLSLGSPAVTFLANKKDKERTGADAFRWFLADQRICRPSPKGMRLHYVKGDTLPVRFTGIDRNGNMLVTSVHPDYEPISGVIRLDAKGTNLYRTEDLVNYLERGRVIDVTWEEDTKGVNKFSFRETLFRFIMDNLHHESLDAVCTGRYGKFTQWWTAKGFMVCSDGTPYASGERKKVFITDWNDKGNIRCEVDGPSTATFTEGETRRAMVGRFAYPRDAEIKGARRDADLTDDVRPIRSLARILLHLTSFRELLGERLDIARAAQALALLTGDAEGEQECERTVRHLENLRFFATGDYEAIRPWVGGTCGADEATDLLLASFADDPKPSGEGDTERTGAIASLVEAALILRENGLAGPQQHVKTEICRLLGIQAVEETDETTEYNFGAESGTQEFKTSVFFAPDGAREQDQMKTIRRVVCAFLNAPLGGTLYIGVNDEGFVSGISPDIEYMEKSVKGGYAGLDGYLRYLRAAIAEAFDQEVWTTLDIRPVMDGKVVAVTVPSYEEKVVSVDGTPWYRFGSECIKIDPQFRRKLDLRKKKKA